MHPSSWVRWNNLEGNEPWFSDSVNAGTITTATIKKRLVRVSAVVVIEQFV